MRNGPPSLASVLTSSVLAAFSLLVPCAIAVVQPTGHEAGLLATADIATAGDAKRNDAVMRSEIRSIGDLPFASYLPSDVYRATLCPLLLVTLILAWLTRPKVSEPMPEGFRAHMVAYLSVWYVAVTADWLQGPYVYELYRSYGFDHSQIAQLFVAGFGASMLFGTFIGSVADKCGRKRCAVLYCVLYAVSCATKHVKLYSVLMLGRVTGGIATSLLFSTFECWLVAEHCQRRCFSQALLRYMFGLMYFGMYVTAIVAGIVSQALVDAVPLRPLSMSSFPMGNGLLFVGGCTAPFDASMLLLLALITPICFMWEENYGDGAGNARLGDVLRGTGRLLAQPGVALLGVLVAGFESSMYVFVFNWTPALDSSTAATPHGLVFSLFMMACICGSSVFSMTNPRVWPVYVLLPTMGLAIIAIGVVCMSLHLGKMQIAIFYAFLLFEFCVGVYFPAIGTLKSTVVPEDYRAGVYNAFRVPLNALVCLILLSDVPIVSSFVACCALLMVATLSLWAIACSPKECGCAVAGKEPAKY